MAYEIDFLPVGNGERSGDAITLRWWNPTGLSSEQFVMVIDGGTQESGKALVEHIKSFYHTNHVNLVVSSHPDADHASGLSVILEEMQVSHLWMHRPWQHARYILELFRDGRITDRGLRETLREALEDAHELERIARRKNIPISEPFSDVPMGYQGITVLSPSIPFYQSLLPHFRETPTPKLAPYFFEKLFTLGEQVITSSLLTSESPHGAIARQTGST